MTNFNLEALSSEQTQRILAVQVAESALRDSGGASMVKSDVRNPGSVDDIIRLAHYIEAGHTGVEVAMFAVPFPFTGLDFPSEGEGEDKKDVDPSIDDIFG